MIEQSAEEITITYTASETGKKFHRSTAKNLCIVGPVGSGKSVTCANHIMYLASKQGKAADGKRYMRAIIVRNTYSELKLTTLKTWNEWFPENFYGSVSKVPPFYQNISFDDIELEVIFLALDKPKDVKKLLSLECNLIWFNEAREIPWAVVSRATERVGRFNRCANGDENVRQVIMDTNPPNTKHWIYKKFEVERPKGFEILHQPPGLIKDANDNWIRNEKADNIENLDKIGLKDYYTDMVNGKTEEEIRVYACGEYGATHEGKRVYAAYNDNIHFARKELDIIPTESIGLGWDWGLTPSLIIMQMSKRGQLRILDEIIGDDIDVRAFVKDICAPYLACLLQDSGIKSVISIGDPSGAFRKDTDASTCIQICNEELKHLNIKTIPAQSNVIKARLDSVNKFLRKLVDGEPALLVSSKAETIREGFQGGYKYAKLNVSGDDKFKEVPDKNEFSHPHDALQYPAMYFAGLVDKSTKTSNTNFNRASGSNWMTR